MNIEIQTDFLILTFWIIKIRWTNPVFVMIKIFEMKCHVSCQYLINHHGSKTFEHLVVKIIIDACLWVSKHCVKSNCDVMVFKYWAIVVSQGEFISRCDHVRIVIPRMICVMNKTWDNADCNFQVRQVSQNSKITILNVKIHSLSDICSMGFVVIGDRSIHFLNHCHVLDELLHLNVQLRIEIISDHHKMAYCNKFVASRSCPQMEDVKFMLNTNTVQKSRKCRISFIISVEK